MNNKVSKQNIIDSIIANENNGIDLNFKSELENSLLNKLNKPINNMKNIFVIGLSFLTIGAFALFMYSSFFALPKNNNAEYDSVISKIVSNDSNQGDAAMKIAVDDHESISAAKSVLSFSALKPYTLFGATLSSVQTGRTFDGSKSDSMYLTFAKDNEYLFKINQMKQNAVDMYVPEDSKELSVTVNGSIVKAYYVEFKETDIDPNSEIALGGELSPAKSMLSFNLNDVYVDISNFGELTLNDLKEIAQSLR